MSRNSVIVLLAAVAVALSATVLFFWAPSLRNNGTAEEERTGQHLGMWLDNAIHTDGLPEAVQTYNAILSSTTLARSEVAPSVLVGSGLQYRLTASTSDAIKGVQELKKVAADTTLRPFIRAFAVLELALAANNAGHNWYVFGEVFKDAPYRQYLVISGGTQNTVASARNVLLYSYQISPTYNAAVAISDYFVVELYRNEQHNVGASRKQQLLDGAEEYLARAEDLVKSTEYEQPKSQSAQESYLVNHAFAVGGLAYFKGGSYKSTYKTEYEALFKTLVAKGDAEAKGHLAISRFWYAAFLLQVDNDKKGAAAQLSQAIALAKADPYFDSNPLVSRIRKLKSGTIPYQAPAKLDTLTALSPEFEAFVESIK